VLAVVSRERSPIGLKREERGIFQAHHIQKLLARVEVRELGGLEGISPAILQELASEVVGVVCPGHQLQRILVQLALTEPGQACEF